MYQFTYHRPKSLADAAAMLEKASDGRLMAGGHTLIPTLKQRLASPTDVVDLSGIADLKGIKVEGNRLRIGAMTTHGEVAGSAEVRKAIPALAALAGGIGDPQVRNRGTIGGSLANNDPAADYPAAVLGLDATIHTNKRQIPADQYFKGMFETALEPGEIIASISFPIPEKAGYAKFPNPASRYAMVGVMVAKTGGGARAAVTGAAPSVFRSAEIEKALGAGFAANALDAVKIPSNGLNSDIHGGADYRAHLIGVMAKRALTAALS